MLVWLSVCSDVHMICKYRADTIATSSSVASLKSKIVYLSVVIYVVQEKEPVKQLFIFQMLLLLLVTTEYCRLLNLRFRFYKCIF